MSAQQGEVAAIGEISLKVIRKEDREREQAEEEERRIKEEEKPENLTQKLAHALPFGVPSSVAWWRIKNLPNILRGLIKILLARLFGIPTYYGALYLTILRSDGTRLYLGLASLRVVTTVGVGYIVDAFQNLVEVEEMKYHGIGTGAVAEAAGDTALGAELTTEYSVNNTRATGTTVEGASANIYRTVGTVTVDSAVAITEHGIFSDVDVAQGVLLDRSVFAVVNLANGDSLQVTYELTFPAGS